MDTIPDFAGVLNLLPLINGDALVLIINDVDASHSGDVLVLLLGAEILLSRGIQRHIFVRRRRQKQQTINLSSPPSVCRARLFIKQTREPLFFVDLHLCMQD